MHLITFGITLDLMVRVLLEFTDLDNFGSLFFIVFIQGVELFGFRGGFFSAPVAFMIGIGLLDSDFRTDTGWRSVYHGLIIDVLMVRTSVNSFGLFVFSGLIFVPFQSLLKFLLFFLDGL
jgi:hypothetical protein